MKYDTETTVFNMLQLPIALRVCVRVRVCVRHADVSDT